MGSWGHKPYQNDDACDFLGGIAERTVKEISRALRVVKRTADADYRYLTAVAAIQLLVTNCRNGAEPNLEYDARETGTFDEALRVLDLIIADAEWVNGWESKPGRPNIWPAQLAGLRRQVINAKRCAKRTDEKARKFFGLPKKVA